MTPNEIATDVSGMSAGMGNITTSVNYTYTTVPGSGQRPDDANTWDR